MAKKISNTADKCSKGHTGRMKQDKGGYYICIACNTLRQDARRLARRAEGLTNDGQKRSDRFTRTESERFWPKVEVTGFCWLWSGAKLPSGHGVFSIKGKPKSAHRWSYENLVGPIPEGLHIDHLCRITSCVNPDHLEPVTQQENNRRGYGISSKFRGRTRCSRGHEYSEGSYYITKRGARMCKACCKIRAEARAVRIAMESTHYK